MAALWLLQAVTGALLVFHWELDDSGVSGFHQPLDPDKLNAALAQWETARPGQHVTAVYTSGGLPGRFDVVISNANGARDVLRVDGEGTILRERPWDHDYAHIGPFQMEAHAVAIQSEIFGCHQGIPLIPHLPLAQGARSGDRPASASVSVGRNCSGVRRSSGLEVRGSSERARELRCSTDACQHSLVGRRVCITHGRNCRRPRPMRGLAGGHHFICSDRTRRQPVLPATQSNEVQLIEDEQKCQSPAIFSIILSGHSPRGLRKEGRRRGSDNSLGLCRF